eukprot:7745319-Pyramimonas_sp.AAC.1
MKIGQAHNRVDMQFSIKELARSMSAPNQGAWNSLIMLGATSQELTAWADTDQSGCNKTHKPASETATWGTHVIQSRGSTQRVVAFSLGEAELCGVVQCGLAASGLQAVQIAAFCEQATPAQPLPVLEGES